MTGEQALRADRNEWMYAAQAARGHYEQSDRRLDAVRRVMADFELQVAYPVLWRALTAALEVD